MNLRVLEPSAAMLTDRPQTTPDVWNELRLAFHRSLLIDTRLSDLAQNIDGCAWDLEGAAETPGSYIDLTYDEVLVRLRGQGRPASRLDDLAEILRGTLAFDESFGAMVDIAGRAEARGDLVQRNLERLGIPAAFPVELCAFFPGTREFCAREGIRTLGEFLGFARGATRQVVIGGEFRDLLNAVVHIDEDTLCLYLPYRRRTSGLYLVESVGLLLARAGLEERMAIARAPAEAPGELRAQVARRVEYFADQAARMGEALRGGVPMARLVVSLEDLSLEAAAAALLAPHFAPPPPPPAPSRPASLWSRLLGRRG